MLLTFLGNTVSEISLFLRLLKSFCPPFWSDPKTWVQDLYDIYVLHLYLIICMRKSISMPKPMSIYVYIYMLCQLRLHFPLLHFGWLWLSVMLSPITKRSFFDEWRLHSSVRHLACSYVLCWFSKVAVADFHHVL